MAPPQQREHRLSSSSTASNVSMRNVGNSTARVLNAEPFPAVITQQSTRSQRRMAGTKNYSNDELMSMLQCIRRVLPIGNDMWQMVAELHALNFPHCNQCQGRCN
jgi:hypothetical protein